MKLILREDYLQRLIHAHGTPDIKVITGLRRSGKSKLLEAFSDYLKKNNEDANIIEVNLNLKKAERLKEELVCRYGIRFY